MSILPNTRDSTAAYRRGVVLVLLAGVCWSSAGLGIRLIETASVWQILFYRSLALAPFLLLVITLRGQGSPFRAVRAAGVSGIVGGGALSVAFFGAIFSIQTTTVANAVFLFAAAPFMTAALGIAILREPVRGATWIAMTVAIGGIAVMVTGGFALGRWVGNAAALASALGFAVFTIALRWKKTEDMMPAVFLAGVFSIIVAGAVCVATDQPFLLPARDVAIALGMGVFQVGAGLVLYTAGSKAIPAGELALLSTGEVVLSPLWVWLFLSETASLYTLGGGAILLAALAGNAISGMRRKPLPVAMG
ncbi:MAG: DMT family transporter [Rhodospirillales bacterium]|jgi:drug/metabolite transporter (DMT)-like permease|nr:DMT family transporter [Rhodospirillales bacterium]